ncbi:MAG: YDG domain-containing protein, partial [Pseudochelatococcus sp.]|uniref:YDG domain-containing protein n=1 Tax=Pseudochelatococcus sp. TaxID=2020869 RepID=UPI003D8FA3F0
GAVSKVYDGNADATLGAGNFSLDDTIAGDNIGIDASAATAAYDNKNVGDGKTVTVAGIALSGGDALNYTLSGDPLAADIGSISRKEISASLTGSTTKVYDGGTDVTDFAAIGVSLDGIVATDTVSVDVTAATGAYDDKNAGNNKTVTLAGIGLTGDDAGNYILNEGAAGTIGSIDPKTITASLAGAVSKVYDGNADATLGAGNFSLDDTIAGDNIGIDASAATAAYDDKNVGDGKTVTVAGIALSGGDAFNYTLSVDPLAAGIGSISPKELSLTGGTVAGREYDGTQDATVITHATLHGFLPGDETDVTVQFTQVRFHDKNAGTDKQVDWTYDLIGTASDNYVFNGNHTTHDGIVTRKPLSVATQGSVATSKIYDGATTAEVSAHGSLGSGVIAGDVVSLVLGNVSYNSKNVVDARTITGNYALNGGDAGNYTLNDTVFSVAGNITPRNIAVATHGTVETTKVYDGNDGAAVRTHGALDGVIAGDAVTLALGNARYNSKNVVDARTITGNYALNGGDAGNYTLNDTVFSVAGNITPRNIVVATHGTVETAKVYDGNDGAAVRTHGALDGVIAGDAVTLALGNTRYNSKNVVDARTITGNYALSGGDTANYILADTGFSVAGRINPATLTIRADTQGKTAGETDPVFTYSAYGWQGADAAGNLLKGELARTAGEHAGIYAITLNTLAAGGNYAIAYIPAAFTIHPANSGDSDPVTPVPVDPSPVDPIPVDPLPIDPLPVDPRPIDPLPNYPIPVDPSPIDPSPDDPITFDPPFFNPLPETGGVSETRNNGFILLEADTLDRPSLRDHQPATIYGIVTLTRTPQWTISEELEHLLNGGAGSAARPALQTSIAEDAD